MSISASTIERDTAGRFVPGQSGNPAGKAPGTRNRSTLLRALMDEGEEQVIGRLVIDKAKAGDAVAARFVIGHLYPRPRARTVALDLADGLPATNVVAAHDAVLTALFAGEIAPDEAEAMTRVLDARMRALRARGQEEYLMKCDRGFPAMPPPKAPLEPMPPYDEDDDEDAADEAKERGRPFRAGAETVLADSPLDSLHSACIQQGPDGKSAARLALEREVTTLVQRLGLDIGAPQAGLEDRA